MLYGPWSIPRLSPSNNAVIKNRKKKRQSNWSPHHPLTIFPPKARQHGHTNDYDTSLMILHVNSSCIGILFAGCLILSLRGVGVWRNGEMEVVQNGLERERLSVRRRKKDGAVFVVS